MSEPVLERSVLERKEREELATIARAMGASPPSRAKKADLVELILTSAGIGQGPTEGGEAEAAEAAEAPTRRGRSRAAVDQTAVDEVAVDDAEAGRAATKGPVADGPEGAAPDQTEGGEVPDAKGGAGGAASRAERSGREQGGGGTPDDTAAGDRPAQGDRNGRGRDDEGNQRSQGGQGGDGNQRNQRNGGGQGDGGGNLRTDGGQQSQEESDGNRRRRRRGRDRDQRGGADEAFAGEPVDVAGLLDLRDEGYGFLRTRGYLPSKEDVYVSVKQVRQFGLRKGDRVAGASRPASKNEKNPALLRIDQVNDKDPDTSRRRPRFDDLTAVFPDQRLTLESSEEASDPTGRIIDLVAPIGKGQRGLVVSPPKAGKTTVLHRIVTAIEANHPEVELFVLLVDERPEEVTDMCRSISGEVVASTFDRPSEEHTAVAELVIERAKRLVEEGRDVVVVLDGLTRLARAYNLSAPGTGRIMSGGVDSGALYPPKRFFGAARNTEEGGSLTILATVLVETGSAVDEVVFEELEGTANMELRLDRRLAERRIFPSIDVASSSTRHEELLIDPEQLQQVWRVRRVLHSLTADGASPDAAIERLVARMATFPTNDELLASAADDDDTAGS